MGRLGLEPRSLALKGRCSTIELTAHTPGENRTRSSSVKGSRAHRYTTGASAESLGRFRQQPDVQRPAAMDEAAGDVGEWARESAAQGEALAGGAPGDDVRAAAVEDREAGGLDHA